MKRFVIGLAFFVLGLQASFAAEKIVVGASPFPHAVLLEQVKPLLAKDGYELVIREFADYVQPNVALEEKNLDANFMQHIPYLENVNQEKKYHLAWVVRVHIEPLGLYSKKVKSLDEIASGSSLAVPNDPVNEARALRLLEKHGLITLKPGKLVTIHDVVDNPKNIKFLEIEAAQLPRTLQDVTAAVINTNFAGEAGLIPSKDAIIIEEKDSPYANVLAVREENKENAKTKALAKALQSPELKKYIEDNLAPKGILPAF